MKSLADQLAHAYRTQEGYYRQVRLLVNEQSHVMHTEPDPTVVLDLCRQVEGLMEQISTIERAIEPTKEVWERDRTDPDGALNGVLESIESEIEQISQLQEGVQHSLLDYIRHRQQQTDDVRASMNASRARTLYKAG